MTRRLLTLEVVLACVALATLFAVPLAAQL
jgi:hypothetical protein